MMRNIKLTLLLTAAILIWHMAAAAQPSNPGTGRSGTPPGKTPPSSEEIARSGTLENGVYKNALVGFSISTPKGWEITSDALVRAGLETSRDLAARGKTQEEKSALNRSISRTAVLFHAAAPGGAFSCGVETLPDPNLTLNAYIAQNQSLILSMHQNSRIAKPSYSKTIGGAAFTAFEVEIPRTGQLVHQTYLVTKRRGAMFFFVMTYVDAATRDQLGNTLDTLRLDK